MKELRFWIQPVHTWSGWWTMVRELSTEAQERAKFFLLILKVLTLIFKACCQCVEVKPWGWTWNRWGPHETWRMPHCALPFLFGRLTRTPAAPFFNVPVLWPSHNSVPELEVSYSPAHENIFTATVTLCVRGILCRTKSVLHKIEIQTPQKMIYVVESAKSSSKNNTSL